jgi:hypothetical protein
MEISMEASALPTSVSAARDGDGSLRSCTCTTVSGLLGLRPADFAASGGLLVPWRQTSRPPEPS